MNIVFCLPGRTFSSSFLLAWTELVFSLQREGINFLISQHYSPVIYYVRNKCLGGDNLKGIDQKPFSSEVQYDYIMWIDSDVIFTPDHFFKLLNHKKDIVSGLYMMSDNINYATVENWDTEYFKNNGHFKFLSREDISNRTEIFPVEYTGMGWMLIKKGVFESMNYPWFEPLWTEMEIDGKVVREFFSEDVSFCKKALKNNFKIYVDPTVIVGHEKSFVI